MSLENENYPQNHDVNTKIPHSGEKVVREFDNTPLAEAVDGNMLSTPQSPEDLPLDQPMPRYETEKTTDKKIGRKVVATISGLLLAGGLGFGAKSMTSNDERVAPTGPVATAPVVVKTEQALTSSETTKPVEAKTGFEAFIASFDISTEKYTTPQAVTAAYFERYTQWMNAGLTVEQDLSLTSVDNTKVVANVESKFDSQIINKLYTNSQAARGLASSISTIRDGTIIDYWVSQNRGDAVPLAVNYELLNTMVISNDNPDLSKATTFMVSAETHITDNGNQNVAPNRISLGKPGQMDIVRTDKITFVRDVATHTWKVDSSYLQSSTNNSK